MRSGLAAVLALFSLPLVAANIRFDPPNPDSLTRVTAHVLLPNCGSGTPTVTRTSSIISITLPSTELCLPTAERQDIAVDLGVIPPGVYDVVVSRGALLIGLAEGTLAVTEANPAFRIEPNVVSTSGGLIHLTNVAVNCAVGPSPIICGEATVKIDGVDAEVKGVGPGEVDVVAPPHAPGIVDVTVQTAAGTFTRTAALNYFSWEGGVREQAFFERVLIPVFYSGGGSFGSQWRTEVALFNGNSFPIEQGSDGLFLTPCMPVCDTRPQPNATVIVAGTNIPTGVVQFLPRQAMPRVQMSLLVRDISRDATDFGTSVPIVRESEFFTHTFSIVNVPADSRYRVGLRLYAYDTIPTTMGVSISALDGTIGVGRTVTLLPAKEHAFLFIGDLLADAPQVAGKGPLRIDIQPLEPATRAWSYVSITNNDTQHVTVIAPE